MTQQIILMCGIPGSGKSTVAKNMLVDDGNDFHSIIISRDEIRKDLVGDGEYFSKEDEVFNTFIKKINEAIECGFDQIIIDATHISRGSRNKVLSKIYHSKSMTLRVVVMETSLEECLRRNALRTGFARVPDSAIHSMYNSFSIPNEREFYRYNYQQVVIKKVKE